MTDRAHEHIFHVTPDSVSVELDRILASVTGRWSLLVIEGFKRSLWSISDNASSNDISVRTIQRHLEKEKSSYLWLRDLYRFKCAVELLPQDLSTKAISREMGFSDRASFEAAMHRWCGMTPSQMRVALLGTESGHAGEELAAVFDVDFSNASADLANMMSTVTERHALQVLSAFTREIWSVKSVADNLGFPARGLQRLLASEKYEFNWLRDLYRFKRAVELLDAGISIQAISDDLGFLNKLSFSSAMKRWCGITPGRFRSLSGQDQ